MLFMASMLKYVFFLLVLLSWENSVYFLNAPCSYSMKKRGKTFETHLDDFLPDVDKLFNIFCHDREQRRIKEEEHKFRMNDSDLAFYHDQNSSRIRKCLSVVENLSRSDINF